MITLLALFACGDSTPTTGPSPEASAEAAEAMCKLFSGARQACTHEAGTLSAAGHEVVLTTVVEQEEEALGFRALVMRVEPTIDGVRRPELDTPATANGGEPREKLVESAMHEWAVIYGVALADSLLADPDRAALRALTADVESGRRVGTAEVYRGWTRIMGGSDTSLDHDAILGHIWPIVEAQPPGPHAVSLRVDSESGSTKYRCELDGQELPELCEAARRYAWPLGGPLTRIRQYYLFTPAAAEPAPEG